MSSKYIFKSPILKPGRKSGVVIGASMVALILGACASSGNSSSRYGSVSDYESGGGCNSAPCAAVATSPATTMIGGQPVRPGIVYTDCSQIAAMGCGAPYAPPVPVYTAPAPVSCPVNMILASDGSCVMPTTSSSGWSTNAVSCPSHTTQASDGTCMIIDDTPTVTIYPPTGYIPPVDYKAPVYQPIRK